MNTLPQEICDQIASYLSRAEISTLAAVSRRWRGALEKEVYAQLCISTTHLDHFDRIFVGRRRSFVKHIVFIVVLPDFDETQSLRFETDGERAANDVAATEQMKHLFTVLSKWKGTDGDHGDGYEGSAFSLMIRLNSPGDYRSSSTTSYGEQFGMTRHENSFITIGNVEMFPPVHCVSRLVFNSRADRRLEIGNQVALTSRLPGLKRAEWTFDERKYTLHRRQVRHRLAVAAETHWRNFSPCLKDISIAFSAPLYKDRQRLPNVAAPTDEASTAFRKLSFHAVSFNFRGILGPSFFWPEASEGGDIDPPPRWPRLEKMQLYLEHQAPSGRWYFACQDTTNPLYRPESDVPLPVGQDETLPPRYGWAEDEQPGYEFEQEYLDDLEEEEEEYRAEFGDPEVSLEIIRHDEDFRRVPDNEATRPLLLGLARALGAMPVLQDACLIIRNTDWARVWYYAPGCLPGASRSTPPRLFVRNWPGGLEPDVVEAFRTAVRHIHNQDMTILYE